jgi:peptidyl-prolyl cis-trans isomerase B (cyclophilin B)
MKKRIFRPNKLISTKDKWQIFGWLLLLIVVFLIVSYIKMKEEANMNNDLNKLNFNNCSKANILMSTTKGNIEVEIDILNMPITSKNFLNLSQNNFYNNLTFHRYVAGFVIQGGDPKGDGTGGSNTTIKLEINPVLKHNAGVIAMARSSDRNSASSQFYFTLAEAHHLDKDYAVFGKVTNGMDNVLKLRAKDKINSIKIIDVVCNK